MSLAEIGEKLFSKRFETENPQTIKGLQLAQLRVKVKSLAAEARIIRVEESKFVEEDRDNLRNHRIWNVRNEARATQLAVAFMKGKDYKKIEPTCKDLYKLEQYILPRIVTMVEKYCTYQYKRGLGGQTESILKDWLQI